MNLSAAQPTLEAERTVIVAAYILHLVGAVTGVASIIGLVLNYVRRGRYGELSDSHHNWMIRSFWWAILWLVIGFVLRLIVIGWAVMGVTMLWYIYRHVRGLISFVNGQPLPV
jgi:uncharacterized membrane protein